MNLVERCERAIAKNTESEAARAWRTAIEAAERGDGAAAAKALSALGEKPRFVATVIVGLAYPSVLVETATAFDAAVAEGTTAVDWQRCCAHLVVQRWGAAARDLEPRILARILNRAYYGAAGVGLLAAIREQIRIDKLDVARTLYAAISPYAKRERAAACAAIGIAMKSTSWMHDAIAAATAGETIQTGGEESEAFAAVLAEFATLPPSHEAVVACVTKHRAYGSKYVEKDARSYGVVEAVQNCVRAGWLDHARSLAEVVNTGRAECDAAIASGQAGPPPGAYTVEEHSIAGIEGTEWPDSRLCMASETALCRLDANDRAGAFEAVRAGIDSRAAATASPSECIAWARALADGGKRDEAIAVLLAQVPRGFPREGWAVAVELFGADAKPFVEAALVQNLAVEKYSHSYETTYAATSLARLVARTNDVELERKLIAAVAVFREYEDREHSQVAQERGQRIAETLRELAGAYPELGGATPTSERLDTWADALGEKSREHIGAATAALAARSLDDIAKRVGQLRPEHAPALAAELAKRGRLADALALIAPFDPRVQQRALVAIGPTLTAAADRKKLVAAFKKCKKTGRDQNAQGMWKFNLGTIMLACDDFDGALEVLTGMNDVRVTNYQPGDLVRAIVKRLEEDLSRLTAPRVEALMNVVGSAAVIPQDVHRPLFAILPTAIVHHREVATRCLQRVRAKFRSGSDVALVDAIEAVGYAQVGDVPHALEKITSALNIAAAGGAIYADAHDFIWCVSKLPRGTARDELWQKAFAVMRTQRPDDAKRVVGHIMRNLDPEDAALAARSIDAANLPHEVAAHARMELGELVATTVDDETLLPLEAASDPPTALRCVQQAARYLARRGSPEAARVAKLAGL